MSAKERPRPVEIEIELALEFGFLPADGDGTRTGPTTRRPRPLNERRAAEYAARTPEPNYAQFGRIGAQYVDERGREYILATGPLVDAYVRAGDIQHPYFITPDPRGVHEMGTQIFWVRIPIRLRGSVEFPDPAGERLEMYFWREQIRCEGRVDGVFVSGPKKGTGYVIVRDFVTLGRPDKPAEYEKVLFALDKPERDEHGLF